nr:carbohydrate ABC transporter permease [uncultured Sphaerochaeta sp.]
MKNVITRKMKSKIAYHLMVALFAWIMVYPVIWMILGAFKTSPEILNSAQTLLPKSFALDNFFIGWKGFAGYSFGIFFKNSFIISLISTLGAVFSAAFIGFGFARCEFRMKRFWFSCMLVSMMLPFQVMMIPQYILFNKMGWIGTFLPIIVPQFFGHGFFIFLNVQFIKGIPIDLDEAAKIDGLSIYGVLFRIILPLIKAASVTCAIFSFMWRWDDFMAALLYLNKPNRYPVSLALKLFSDPATGSDWGSIFAMASLSLLPIFLIFLTMQKYLVEGIAATGIKN